MFLADSAFSDASLSHLVLYFVGLNWVNQAFKNKCFDTFIKKIDDIFLLSYSALSLQIKLHD